ncbi:MAG: PorV/PorQ family protein [candidate division WOR-3 bacterium]
MFFCVLLTLLKTTTAAAVGYYDGPGSSVLALLKAGQGARPTAMGESNIGLADDAATVYWNPAGLGKMSDYHFSFTHSSFFSDINDELIHSVLPFKQGAFGLGLVYSGTSGIEFYDEFNNPGDTFATYDGVLTLGYGAPVAANYYLGGAVKACYENLLLSKGFGGALDLGFWGRPLPFLGIGAVIRNLGLMRYNSTSEYPPGEIGIGISYTGELPIPSFQRDFKVVLDGILPFDSKLNLRFGIEYLPVSELALRFGYRSGPADLSDAGLANGITAGVGVNLGKFALDYSLSPYGKLGFAHRLSLSLKLLRKGLGSLRLRVIDAETRRPLWAQVTLSGIKDFKGETDKSGELLQKGLLPGQLVIYTYSPGYNSRTDTMRILGDREQSAVIALERVKYSTLLGTIYDAATNKPISGNITYQGPAFGKEVADSVSGTFVIRSLPSGKYTLNVQGPEGYIPQSCTLTLEPGKIVRRDFYLVKPKETIILEGVNFETGKADILPKFIPILNKAGRILQENPGIVVELAGHTDPREINTAEFPSNWELSQARAEAVRKFLIENFQIAPERLIARGYADTQPIAPNDTEEGMAKNRRTEFRIIGE